MWETARFGSFFEPLCDRNPFAADATKGLDASLRQRVSDSACFVWRLPSLILKFGLHQHEYPELGCIAGPRSSGCPAGIGGKAGEGVGGELV